MRFQPGKQRIKASLLSAWESGRKPNLFYDSLTLQTNVYEWTKTTGGLVLTKPTSDNIVSLSFGGGLGGFGGGGVHASAFSK